MTPAGTARRHYLGIDADRHDYVDTTLGIRVQVWRSIVLSVGVFKSVERMRTAPIVKKALLGVLIPAVLPMLAVVAIRIPLKQILLTIVKTLV